MLTPDELDAILSDLDATRGLNHSPETLSARQTAKRLAAEVERCWRQRSAVLRALGCASVPHDATDDAVVAHLRHAERTRTAAATGSATTREAIELSNAITVARNMTGIYAERLATITAALGLPVTATAEDILAAMAER